MQSPPVQLDLQLYWWSNHSQLGHLLELMESLFRCSLKTRSPPRWELSCLLKRLLLTNHSLLRIDLSRYCLALLLVQKVLPGSPPRVKAALQAGSLPWSYSSRLGFREVN